MINLLDRLRRCLEPNLCRVAILPVQPVRGSGVFAWLLALSLLTAAVPRALADPITFIESLANGQGDVTWMSTASDVDVAPDGRHVYVAATAGSAVVVFTRNVLTGQLAYAGATTGLSSAFSVAVSPDGRHVYAASPTSSYVILLTRDNDTGLLTREANYTGVTSTGFVSVTVSPDGRYVYAVAGSSSGLVVWARDALTGALTLVADYPDDVDGHMLGQLYSAYLSPINNIAVTADGAFVYVTSTKDNAVTVFAKNPLTGELSVASTVVDGVDGVDGISAASSLVLSPDNTSVYVSGQGEHSVAHFSRDATTGALTYIGKKTQNVDGIITLSGSRSLAVSPDGRYVYVSAIQSNAITVFERNPATGELSFATAVQNGIGGVTGLGSVSGMVTDPLNRNLYAAGQTQGSIANFALGTPAVVLSRNGLSVPRNSPAILVDDELTVLDGDDPTLSSARVFIGSGFVAGDTLSVTIQGNIAASYDAASGILSLAGVDTLAAYQAVLRTVRLQIVDDPNLGPGQTAAKTISFEINDGENTSAEAIVYVTVSAEPATYTLTYTPGTNGTILGAAVQTVSAGGSGSPVTAVPSAGYSFVQWSDASTANPRMDTDVTADVSVSASFAINTYAVTANATGNGTIGPASATVAHGATTTFSVVPGSGSGIAYVTGCSGRLSGTTYTTGPITAACVVRATFAVNSYSVAATAGEGGSISPANRAVSHGGTTTFTLTPAEGYLIAGVTGCGGTLNGTTYTTAAITGTCSIAATFERAGPVFLSAPLPDLDINARSLLTPLPGNVAPAARDAQGDALMVTLVGGRTYYAPGVHELTWRAVDSRGVAVTATQVLRVWPTVAMGKDVTLGFTQGNSGSFRIALNGLSPVYPFTVNYTVTGSAQGHDLHSGTAVFEDGEVEKEVFFAILNTPPVGTPERVLEVELDPTLNRAERDRLSVSLITINAAPVVTLSATQQGQASPSFSRGGGPITIAAEIRDPNSADEHTLDWRAPTGANVQAQGHQLVVQADSLAVGVHRFELVAGDSGTPSLSASALIDVVITRNPVALPQGVSRWSSNALPDDSRYSPAGRNVLPKLASELDRFLIEADAGVQLALGAHARSEGAFQAQLKDGATILPDTVTNVGGYVDFAITDLPVAGQSVSIVIPQSVAVPANAVYRKFIGERWVNFTEGAMDELASAPGAEGNCPPPQSEQYRRGLNVGDWCVRLTISDGGPNDADARVNGAILDPGGVGVSSSVVVTSKSSGGGGSFNLLLLLALGGLLALRKRDPHVVASAAMLGLASGVATADETSSRWYVAASIAQAHGDVGSAKLSSALQREGFEGAAVVDHHDRFAWQVRGGFQWTKFVGFELGYADLGDANAHITGVTDDVPALLELVNESHPHAPAGVEAAVVGRVPLNEMVSLVARGGAWRWESEFRSRNVAGEFSARKREGTDAVYGAGVQFDVWPRLSIRAEWSCYEAGREKIEAYGAGLKYRF